MLDQASAEALDRKFAEVGRSRRFFHWTPQAHAASIRIVGFRPSPSGVQVSTDRDYYRRPGDVCLTIDVPEQRIRPG